MSNKPNSLDCARGKLGGGAADLDSLDIRRDKLEGAQEIAEFLGTNVPRVRHLIRFGLIPYGKEGANRIIASRRALREHYARATKAMLVD
jgi:hypothetical protein